MPRFIGFTGTPIALEDKDTRAVFGDYVSIYDIQDAVDDGATVPIFYESRLAKLDVNQAEIDALNEQVDEVMEDEEDIASREKTKSEWAALEKLVGAEPRLAQVAKDLVEHFETRSATLDGKAMIVCMSRDICAQLYKTIVTLRPDWHERRSGKRRYQGRDDRFSSRQGTAAAAPVQQAGEKTPGEAGEALQGR
jgi:type I restriction enzyme R subunit